jgi:hypothetical protein
LEVAASDGVAADAVDGTGSFFEHGRDGELLTVGGDPDAEAEPDDAESRIARQAGEQSDHDAAQNDDLHRSAARERDPEY